MRGVWAAMAGGLAVGCGLAPYAAELPVGTIDSADTFVPGRACPPDSSLSWDNFGQRFMERHCTHCHSADLSGDVARSDAPAVVDLDTVEGVRAWTLRVYERAADDNSGMPPSGSVSQSDRRALGDWLACGAP